MGQTHKKYPEFEAAILVHNLAVSGAAERAMEGDIVGIRRPHYEVGTKERSAFLWLRLQGLEENDMSQLAAPYEEADTIYDKRRYCIPLARLKQIVPSLDLARVRDRNDAYQPFMSGVDADTAPGPTTYAAALVTLQGEGMTESEAIAHLAPLVAHIRTDREKEAHRLPKLMLFRKDGVYYHNPPLAIRGTGGHYLAPKRALSVFGLVYDKQTQEYL